MAIGRRLSTPLWSGPVAHVSGRTVWEHWADEWQFKAECGAREAVYIAWLNDFLAIELIF